MFRFGSVDGGDDGGVLFADGIYPSPIAIRRSVCGCANLPDSVTCFSNRQLDCDDPRTEGALECGRHCAPTNDAGHRLRDCRLRYDGPTPGFHVTGAPYAECDYASDEACGCGPVRNDSWLHPCGRYFTAWPCDVTAADIVDAGWGPKFVPEVCARVCPPSGTTGCGPGVDPMTNVRMIECYGMGCPGRRPDGLAPVAPASGSPVGAYFADASRMEAASVDAFEVLRDELAQQGAPAELIARAARAAADEVRHARITATLARRFGVEDGAWAEKPDVIRREGRTLEAIAIENAVEGCVSETYAALVAIWQADNARGENVRRAMHAIAEDETRHAALAYAVAAWADTRLDENARGRVAAARANALNTLAQSVSRQPSPPALADAGLALSPTQALALFRALLETIAQTQLQTA